MLGVKKKSERKKPVGSKSVDSDPDNSDDSSDTDGSQQRKPKSKRNEDSESSNLESVSLYSFVTSTLTHETNKNSDNYICGLSMIQKHGFTDPANFYVMSNAKVTSMKDTECFSIPKLQPPKQPGVYFISIVKPNSKKNGGSTQFLVLYVGKSINLRNRICKEYITTGSHLKEWLVYLIAAGFNLYFAWKILDYTPAKNIVTRKQVKEDKRRAEALTDLENSFLIILILF
jgi:hypothetical protein